MAGLIVASVLGVGLWSGGAAQAAKLTAIKGAQADRYGRIVLKFDSPVSVKARVSGSVLVIGFSERSGAAPERIAAEMPDYVSVVRRDPDGLGLRLALQRPYRVNVQEAGESVFIDLLPPDWAGLPPALPSEVVAELFRRTQAAEAVLRTVKPAVEPTSLKLELAQLPTLTRLSLRLPASAQSPIDAVGPAARVTVPGAWRIDEEATRGRLKPAIEALQVENDATGAHLLVTPAEGYAVRTFRDEDGVTVDVARVPEAKPKADAKADTKSAAAVAPAPNAGEANPADVPVLNAPRPPGEVRPSGTSLPPQQAVLRPAGPGLVFPFQRMPSAALFERAGIANLVFETAEPVSLAGVGGLLTPLGPPQRTGRVVTLRFPVPRDRLFDLVPAGPADAPTGWELVAGDNLAASELLAAIRNSDAAGRIGIGVRLPNPGSATWLDLDGERIAVVTGYGPKPAGIPKRQAFVDFELLPSRQGVAVLAQADDLLVRPDIDGVSIGRETGMAVSGVARASDAPLAPVSDLAIDRGPWEASQRGDTRELMRDQLQAAADAPRAVRGPLRMVLARSLLANRLGIEALGVLKAAASEDPVLAGQRDVPMLSAVANALIGRIGDARLNLSVDILKNDPEARLWQAYLDASEGRWAAADSAFRATSGVLDRYPDDIQALLRLAAAEAAIETGDWDSANRHIIAAARMGDHRTQDALALLRARIEEVTGQTVAALDTYERLGESADARVAALARLRATMLGHASGKIPVLEAIDRLEGVALGWHGGDIEPRTIANLAKLYVEAGRWRQALLTARRADAMGTDTPLVREVHDMAQALFDDLYLGERSLKLTGVEALALYFDFKDFAPIGRRGDEIVRRLADRLVELDLLDSAGELLQHQVDHRLQGASRASVAARLAAIRLMDQKPLMALKSLDTTYLPELPEDLRRARALLRARALSDLSRTDLALETIEGETGSDAARLRADILWTGRRWREAGEAHEALVGEAWRRRVPLDDAARTDVLRTAIAYGLAGETLGLERLRAKFAGPMAESVDARTFALLTQPNAVRSPGFREIAQKATSAETLQAFLSEYRKRYPDSAVPAPGKRDADARADAQSGATPPG